MIVYDPHSLTSFLRWRGSVFPKACYYAICPATLAFALKFLDNQGVVELDKWDTSKEQSVYQGFTFVLGFVMVFHASQSYNRYWEAAHSIRRMGADWYEVASSLISFAQASTEPLDQIKQFKHTTVRLVCMLHAMALEEIVSLTDKVCFPLLDIEGMVKEDLRILAEPAAQGRKVEIVNQWIKAHILQSMRSNVLSVPPPIITRVFQQLGSGLVNYHEVAQVVIWPFPFPYAQLSCILLVIHALLTPLILAKGAEHALSAGILTFISVVCMKAIELIAAELENPFGHDANDLPTYELHREMMHDLVQLTHPETFHVPRLLPTAILEHQDLLEHTDILHSSLPREKWSNSSIPRRWRKKQKTFLSKKPKKFSAKDRKVSQMETWIMQEQGRESEKLSAFLRLDEPDPHVEDKLQSIDSKSIIADASQSITISRNVASPEKLSEVLPVDSNSEKQRDLSVSQVKKGAPDRQEPPWRDFLHEFSDSMRQFFSDQSGQLKAAHDLQLSALEQVLQTVVQADGTKPQSQSLCRSGMPPVPRGSAKAKAEIPGLARI